MADRRHGGDRRRKKGSESAAHQRARKPTAEALGTAGIEAHGWTILAHPLFLDQVEKLIVAAEAESSGLTAEPGPNTKLLAHLLDLALEKIPRDPGNAHFRHGGTLGSNRRHWFRAKTGNGRYRLFYRFHSAARIIVYAWVNDEDSLRTYGSASDAYAVFARVLENGNPPDDFDSLVGVANSRTAAGRFKAIVKRRRSGSR